VKKILVIAAIILLFIPIFQIRIGYAATYVFTNVQYENPAPANMDSTINATVKFFNGTLVSASKTVQLASNGYLQTQTKGTIGGEVSNAGFVSFIVHYPQCPTGQISITVTLTTTDGDATTQMIITVYPAYTAQTTGTETEQSCEPDSGKDVFIKVKFVDTSTNSATTVNNRKLAIYDKNNILYNQYSFTIDPIGGSAGEYLYTINFISPDTVTDLFKFTVYGEETTRISIKSSISINIINPHFYFKIVIDGNDQNKYVGRDGAMQGISQGQKTIDLYAASSKYESLTGVVITKVEAVSNNFRQDITNTVKLGSQNSTWWRFQIGMSSTTMDLYVSADKYRYGSLTEKRFQITTLSENVDWLQFIMSPMFIAVILAIIGLSLLVKKLRSRSTQPVVMM
jgi:hypothetical protein